MPITESLLYLSAITLGLLAFFEPCTIATHTLFAARLHQQPSMRMAALLQFLIARSAFLAGLFSGAAWLSWPTPNANMLVILLLIAGTVYAVSRSIYLPIPHLSAYQIIPGGLHWPHSVQLGLTLPACTLPLIALIMMLSAAIQHPGHAALAGLIFAICFSMPTIWQSWHGISPLQRIWLGRIAAAAPYLTAMLLCSTALYLWIV